MQALEGGAQGGAVRGGPVRPAYAMETLPAVTEDGAPAPPERPYSASTSQAAHTARLYSSAAPSSSGSFGQMMRRTAETAWGRAARNDSSSSAPP